MNANRVHCSHRTVRPPSLIIHERNGCTLLSYFVHSRFPSINTTITRTILIQKIGKNYVKIKIHINIYFDPALDQLKIVC